MATYTYGKLEQDEIRLLELKWGEEGSILVANLLVRRLLDEEDEELRVDGSPGIPFRVTDTSVEQSFVPMSNPFPTKLAESYEAVSYCWGGGPTTPIMIIEHTTQHPIPIRSNLENALRQFRTQIPPHSSQLFWIDALCIDQSNKQEKSAQIKKMSLIYNRASNVKVWLGIAYEDSDRAVSFIQKFLKLDDFDRLIKDPVTPTDWLAFMNLLRRPWFNRRWIVQEIGLARRATVYCGACTVPWQSFSNAVALFTSKNNDLRKLFQKSAEFDHHPDLLGEVEALGANDLVNAAQNLVMKSEEGVVMELQYSLEALMSLLTAFEVSVPHDTVYAILWLAHDAEPESTRLAARSEGPVALTPSVGSPVDSPVYEGQENAFQELSQSLSRTMSRDSINDSPGMKPLGNSLGIPSSSTRHGKSAVDKSLREAEQDFAQAYKDKPKPFVVNYELSVYEVCKQFLDFAITRSKSLDIICRPWAPLPAKDKKEEPLPSWMPSLSGKPFGLKRGSRVYTRVQADPLVGKPGLGPRIYNACGKTRAYWGQKDLVREKERELVAVGFELDRIGDIEDRAHGGIIPCSWLELAEWTDMEEPPPERFWRTLVADRGTNGQKPPVYFQAACKWAFEQRAEGDGLSTKEPITHGKCPSIASEFLRRVQAVVWDRKLFQSRGRKYRPPTQTGTPRLSKKLFGLAPGKAQAGDYICILYGCSVPVVLRKIDNPGLSRETTVSSEGLSDGSGTEKEWTPTKASPQRKLSRTQSMQESSAQHRRKSSASLMPPLITNASGETARARGTSPTAKTIERYQFIGECYVHGMMDGEGFKHKKEHRIPLHEIHLV